MTLGRFAFTLARLLARPLGWPPPLRISAPPETLPASLSRASLTLDLSGVSFETVLYHPSRGEGWPVALALRGGGAPAWTAWPWIEALTGQGVAVLSPDLDGHGDNPRPYTSLDQAAELIPAALTALARRGLSGRVGMLGASLGGTVALKGLACYPASALKVGALALLAAPHAATFGQLLTPRLLRSLWEDQHLPTAPIRRATPRARFAVFRNTLARESLLDAARAVRATPLLLVHGQYDPFAPPRQGRDYARAHGAAAVWIVPTGHAGAMYDPAMVRRVAVWLAERLADKARA